MEESRNLKLQFLPLAQATSRQYHEREAEIDQRKFALREKMLAFTPKLAGALLMLELPAWRIMPYIYGYWYEPMESSAVVGHLGAYVEGLVSWKQFEPALVALQAAGLELDKWTSYDEAQSYTRVFKQMNFFEERVGIRLHATLVGDTEECKRVLVGYGRTPSISADPIYKLECKE